MSREESIPGKEKALLTPSVGVIRAGCFLGRSGARLPLAPRRRPAPSGKYAASIELAPPCGLDAPAAHRVVDGSFRTRRWARIEVSMGFSWGVGLELLSAEYVAAMAPWERRWEVRSQGGAVEVGGGKCAHPPPQPSLNSALLFLHGHESRLLCQTGGFRGQRLWPPELTLLHISLGLPEDR